MGVVVSVLASGSRGNSAVVQTSRQKSWWMPGFPCRETFKRMKALEEDPGSLSAILVTHEHSDHVYGLRTLAKKLKVPVFMTGATHQSWAKAMRDEDGDRPEVEKLEIFAAGKSFQVGDIAVTPSRSRMMRRIGGLHVPAKGSRSGSQPTWDMCPPACAIICGAVSAGDRVES